MKKFFAVGPGHTVKKFDDLGAAHGAAREAMAANLAAGEGDLAMWWVAEKDSEGDIVVLGMPARNGWVGQSAQPEWVIEAVEAAS